MKLAIGFFLLSGLLLVYGSPCHDQCSQRPSGISIFTSQASYFNAEVCKASGYSVRQYIPNYYWDQVQQTLLDIQCRLLSHWNDYPDDIGGCLGDYTDNHFHIVMLGAGGSNLGSLITLLESGKQVLMISESGYPPLMANSIYNRGALYGTDEYVSRYSVDCGNGITKYLYSSKTVGGLSILDQNEFVLPGQSCFDQWKSVNDLWSWDKVQPLYQQYEYKKSVTINQSPFGSSICRKVTESYESTTIKSAYSELGYNSLDYNSGVCDSGLYTVPYISERNKNKLLSDDILKYVARKYRNFKLSLFTQVKRVIFKYQQVVAVVVITYTGEEITIYMRDYCIIGYSPIETSRLLFNSGIGESSLLQRYNIETVLSAPTLGQRVSISPIYNGVILRVKSGSILQEDCSDSNTLDYLLGQSSVRSSIALEHLKYYMRTSQSRSPDVQISMQVFSKWTIKRLRYHCNHIFQYDTSVTDLLIREVLNYDLVFFRVKLTRSSSSAYITFNGNSITPYIKYNMFGCETDILSVIEAVIEIKRLYQTSVFRNLGCETISLPIGGCSDIFSHDYIRKSIYALSSPDLYALGGTIMGNSIQDSIVDANCRVHTIPNLVIFGNGIVPFNDNFDSIASSMIIGNYAASLLISSYEKKTFEAYSPYYSGTSVPSLALSTSSYDSNLIGGNTPCGCGGDSYLPPISCGGDSCLSPTPCGCGGDSYLSPIPCGGDSCLSPTPCGCDGDSCLPPISCGGDSCLSPTPCGCGGDSCLPTIPCGCGGNSLLGSSGYGISELSSSSEFPSLSESSSSNYEYGSGSGYDVGGIGGGVQSFSSSSSHEASEYENEKSSSFINTGSGSGGCGCGGNGLGGAQSFSSSYREASEGSSSSSQFIRY